MMGDALLQTPEVVLRFGHTKLLFLLAMRISEVLRYVVFDSEVEVGVILDPILLGQPLHVTWVCLSYINERGIPVFAEVNVFQQQRFSGKLGSTKDPFDYRAFLKAVEHYVMQQARCYMAIVKGAVSSPWSQEIATTFVTAPKTEPVLECLELMARCIWEKPLGKPESTQTSVWIIPISVDHSGEHPYQ